MRRVLVTGFGAYAEEADNPSGAVARRLDGTIQEGVRIAGVVLPVATERVRDALAAAIESVSPDVVLVTGVTPGRAALALERVAVNVRDFPIPDVDGLEPIDERVVDDGPAAYFSTLPIKTILQQWRSAHLPGYVSNSAGTYLCNQAFYLARHLTEVSPAIAGLVHLPLASSSAAAAPMPGPSLPLDLLEEAVRLAALIAATHTGRDLHLPAGATS